MANQYQNPWMFRNQTPPQGQQTGEANGQEADQASWMENPALAGIDPAKLQFLSSLASQARGKNQNELLPFLMAAASQSKQSNMTFLPDEVNAIIQVLKIGKSPQEIQRIDRLIALMGQLRPFG